MRSESSSPYSCRTTRPRSCSFRRYAATRSAAAALLVHLRIHRERREFRAADFEPRQSRRLRCIAAAAHALARAIRDSLVGVDRRNVLSAAVHAARAIGGHDRATTSPCRRYNGRSRRRGRHRRDRRAVVGVVRTRRRARSADVSRRRRGLDRRHARASRRFLAVVFKGVSWSVLPLVAGALRARKGGRDGTGVLAPLTAICRERARRADGTAFAVGAIAALACGSLVNNLPLGLAAGHLASSAHLSARASTGALLVGVDLGPNLSVTGSLATILWLLALRGGPAGQRAALPHARQRGHAARSHGGALGFACSSRRSEIPPPPLGMTPRVGSGILAANFKSKDALIMVLKLIAALFAFTLMAPAYSAGSAPDPALIDAVASPARTAAVSRTRRRAPPGRRVDVPASSPR